jgi:hypothetical protein
MRRRGMRNVLGGMALAVAAWLAMPAVEAHTLGQSYLYLRIYQHGVGGRFEVSLADFNRALRLTGTDREVTADTLDRHVPMLQEYYRRHVRITDGQRELPYTFTEHGYLKARGGYVLLSFDIAGLDAPPGLLRVDYSVLFDEDPQHRGFLLVEYNWATGTFANESHVSAVFTPTSRTQDFVVTSEGRLRGFLGITWLGIEHIWMGFDHVLFLVALLLPAVLRRDGRTWRQVDRFGPALLNVVKIVTAFTVAHSLTLSLAALGHVTLPERLVEVAIAGSIAIAAADILVPVFRGRVWIIVFGFGLFHGFGFAGALADMGVLGEHLGLALFGFNLGVEIGQVAIVALLFPVLFALRQLAIYRSVALPAAAVLMILVSSAWVVQRAMGLDGSLARLVLPAVQKGIS